MSDKGIESGRLHTTALGRVRIQRNLELPEVDVVDYCRRLIFSDGSVIERRGKNLYVTAGNCLITINASTNTIITAKKL